MPTMKLTRITHPPGAKEADGGTLIEPTRGASGSLALVSWAHFSKTGETWRFATTLQEQN